MWSRRSATYSRRRKQPRRSDVTEMRSAECLSAPRPRLLRCAQRGQAARQAGGVRSGTWPRWLRRARPMRVVGQSMAPMLHDGTLVFVDESVYSRRAPQRGEIVAVRPAALGGTAVVKRISAGPDEQVRVLGREWRLGSDQYFVIGDYADDSLDSRKFGPVTQEELIGRVWLRVWPPKMLSAASP